MGGDVETHAADRGLGPGGERWLIGARLADRFVVERRLGEGGMGVVFEALDEQRGERVALKTLGQMDGGSVYNLKQEFRALADLAHPRLVRLHELFSDRGVWFFTMARVDGLPFYDYVRAASGLANAERTTGDGALEDIAKGAPPDGARAGACRRSRGNRWAANAAATTYGSNAWLARDEVDAALREADAAIEAWPGRGYQFQHLLYLVGRGFIDLYRAEGASLHERIEREWPALRRSGFLFAPNMHAPALHLRGGAALAAAVQQGPGQRSKVLVAAAERHARKLARIPATCTVALAALLRAGAANLRAERDESCDLLDAAAKEFDAIDMKMYAIVARRQLGRVRGGDEGAALVEQADAAMRAEGIVRPDRFAATLAPGFPDP